MTALVSVLPALILLGGALIVLLPLPIPLRFRIWIPLLANALAALAILQLARITEPVTLFEPSDVLPSLSLTLQWNGAALLFGLFLLLTISARLLIGGGEDASLFTAGTLGVEAGSLLFLAADNWTTIAAAWLIVEFGLLLVPDDESTERERVGRALGWNVAAIVAWLTAGMILFNEGSTLRLEEMALQGTAALLVFLAIWIRSGLYPFHAAAPTSVSTGAVRLGIPLLLAGYLMTRWLSASHAAMSFQNDIEVLVLLAVGISALLTIGQPHGGDAFVWMLRAVAAPLLLLPFWVSARAAPAISVWLTLGALAVCTIVSVAWLWRAQTPREPYALVVWIAALVLSASLPLAPGWWGRVGFLATVYGQGQIALWLLLVAMLSLVLIPLWREIFASREVAPKAITRFEIGALVCLGIASVAVMFDPFAFVTPFGRSAQEGSNLALNALVRPTGIPALIFLLAGLAVPPLASFELARRWDRRANLVPLGVTNWLDLSPLARGLDWLYRFLRALVLQTLGILEQPPIAWLLFLAIWIAVWLRGLGNQ